MKAKVRVKIDHTFHTDLAADPSDVTEYLDVQLRRFFAGHLGMGEPEVEITVELEGSKRGTVSEKTRIHEGARRGNR